MDDISFYEKFDRWDYERLYQEAYRGWYDNEGYFDAQLGDLSYWACWFGNYVSFDELETLSEDSWEDLRQEAPDLGMCRFVRHFGSLGKYGDELARELGVEKWLDLACADPGEPVPGYAGWWLGIDEPAGCDWVRESLGIVYGSDHRESIGDKLGITVEETRGCWLWTKRAMQALSKLAEPVDAAGCLLDEVITADPTLERELGRPLWNIEEDWRREEVGYETVISVVETMIEAIRSVDRYAILRHLLSYFEDYRDFLVKVSLGQIENPGERALIPQSGQTLIAAALDLGDRYIHFAYNRYCSWYRLPER